MELPPDLRQALDRAVQGLPLQRLQAVAEALSERYRQGHGQASGAFLRHADDVLAYVATRMPATWAAVRAALAATAEQLPDWAPRSLSDAGAGPGTAAWAACTVWPELSNITLLERDTAMQRTGRALATTARAAALRTAHWQAGDVLKATPPPADLVTAAYLVGELPAAQLAGLVERLWSATQGVLVVIEPGTPRGFALVRAIRAQLIGLGAHLVAPCPHADACPIQEPDWCHFAARVARSRLHRASKGASKGFEDEKFAYVAVARNAATPAAARVLRHPHNAPGRITLELCTAAGLETRSISKRDAAWRAARNAEWGAAFPQTSDLP